MEKELNVVNFQVRISKQERDQLEAIAGKRQMQNYVRRLIQDAIAGKRGYPYPLHMQEHEALEAILCADGDLADAVRKMLISLANELPGAELVRLKQTRAR